MVILPINTYTNLFYKLSVFYCIIYCYYFIIILFLFLSLTSYRIAMWYKVYRKSISNNNTKCNKIKIIIFYKIFTLIFNPGCMYNLLFIIFTCFDYTEAYIIGKYMFSKQS